MKRKICLIIVLALWLGLTAFAWVKPADADSESERRELAQFPPLTVETLMDGSFMTDFADYAVDQFPLRDGFRRLNAYLTYYILNQTDNNGIYVEDGYAAKMEYPLNESSVQYACDRFNDLYEMYLQQGSHNIVFCSVPDKGYYLAEEAGALSMDYDKLMETLEGELDWAAFADVTGALSLENYYRTDTHWRQETILPAAQIIAGALNVSVGEYEEYSVSRPFYGVYYGQAALPMEPDELQYLSNEILENCTVTCVDNGTVSEVYDMTKLNSRDLYDVFLSGAAAMLVVENPSGDPDRELVVFRDSFGSSMIPLLLQDYSKVTILDTRYISPGMIGEFVEFTDQDVLFLYSTLVLNSSSALRK